MNIDFGKMKEFTQLAITLRESNAIYALYKRLSDKEKVHSPILPLYESICTYMAKPQCNLLDSIVNKWNKVTKPWLNSQIEIVNNNTSCIQDKQRICADFNPNNPWTEEEFEAIVSNTRLSNGTIKNANKYYKANKGLRLEWMALVGQPTEMLDNPFKRLVQTDVTWCFDVINQPIMMIDMVVHTNDVVMSA